MPDSDEYKRLRRRQAELDAIAAHRAALNAQSTMTRLAHERDEAIREALEAGASGVALADALGLTRQRIYNMARKPDKAN